MASQPAPARAGGTSLGAGMKVRGTQGCKLERFALPVVRFFGFGRLKKRE